MPKVLGNLDLNKNQIQNAILQPLSTAPANPKEGQIYYNSTDKNLYRYNGTSWVTYQSPLQIETVTEVSIDTLVTSNSSNLITSGAVSTAIGDILPTVTTSDNGKVLKVVSGKWNKAEEQIDDTLTIQGVPADAKAVGDALVDKASVIIDKSMTVEIEPVQDLHGYDNPWPAGGGKNLLSPKLYSGGAYNPTVGTVWNLTESATQFSNPSLGVYTISFTSSWIAYVLLCPVTVGQHYRLSYTGGSTGNCGRTIGYLDANFKVLSATNSTETSFNVNSDLVPGSTAATQTAAYLYLVITNRSSSSATITINNPQIELGTTKTDFAPYENICPITGWTGTTIMGAGANLWGGQLFADAILSSCTSAATQSENIVTLPNGANNVNSSTTNRVKMFENQFQDGSYTIIIGQPTDSESTLMNKSLITAFYTDGTNVSITTGHYDATNKLWRYVSNSAKRLAFLRMNRDEASRQEYDISRCGIFQGNVPITDFVSYTGESCSIIFNKNKFNGTLLQGYWAYANGNFTSDTKWVSTEKIPCKPSTYYTVSADDKLTRWQGFVWYNSNGGFISTSNLQQNINIGYTAQSPSNAAYLAFNIAGYPSTTSTISPSDVTQLQIEEGQSATVYEPPIGTIYGGIYETNEDGIGVLTVDRGNIASYAGETLPGAWISSMDVYTAGGTPTTGAQVVYELATPLTYTLTRPQVKPLFEQDNLWADTGDVSIMENRCDTKVYIDNKISTVYTAINNITGLPSQTGNSGKFLTTDGTTASWVSLPVYDGTVV